MEVGKVFTDGVTVSERLRRFDEAKMDALTESINSIGLQQPISIWVDGDAPILVAGRYRLAVAIKLGWTQIDCVFVTLDDLDRQLWEIDENLCRAELSGAERSEHLKRRKDIFDKKRNQVVQIEPPENEVGYKKPPPQKKGFATDTAEKTGMSKAAINKSINRAENIAEDVREDIKTSQNKNIAAVADSGVELDALASLSHDQQRQAVKRVEDGTSKTVREAKTFIHGIDPEQEKEEELFKSLWNAWRKASPTVRQRFLNAVDETSEAA